MKRRKDMTLHTQLKKARPLKMTGTERVPFQYAGEIVRRQPHHASLVRTSILLPSIQKIRIYKWTRDRL